MSSGSLASNIIGSSVKDMYGRFLGRVVSISYDAVGDVTAIQVERGGSLVQHPIGQVSIDRKNVVLIPEWSFESNVIQKEWSLTQKKIFALDKLLRSGKVSQAVYENIRKQRFEPVIKKLRSKRDSVLTDLRKRFEELKLQIQKLENSIAEIELELMIGKMDDQTHKKAYESIKPLIDAALKEKKDVEILLEHLEKLDRAHL